MATIKKFKNQISKCKNFGIPPLAG
jgi:hypothetical protein